VHARFRRRFQRRPVRPLIILLALALLVALRFFFDTGPAPTPGQPLPAGEFAVERVIDGDTLLVDDHVTVRLIGVNTPETVRPEYPVEPFGPEASAFTQAFVRGGRVRLEYDRERFDRFGRHLAYVWVGPRMLNEELLRAGLGRWEPGFDYSQQLKDRFRRAQQEARAAHLGIWSEESGQR
jgi:micrococcal nuclease